MLADQLKIKYIALESDYLLQELRHDSALEGNIDTLEWYARKINQLIDGCKYTKPNDIVHKIDIFSMETVVFYLLADIAQASIQAIVVYDVRMEERTLIIHGIHIKKCLLREKKQSNINKQNTSRHLRRDVDI